MTPLFFGPRGSLFACYHPGVALAPSGVVVLPSAGDESVRFHRALLKLAQRLAGTGRPALRLDLFGCGDSAGDLEQASLKRWIDDAQAAIDELRRRSGVERIHLVGLRLGGTVAAATAARADVASVVLWDPVHDGAAFLAELGSLHAEMERRSHVVPRPAAEDGLERLGFRWGSVLVDELRALRTDVFPRPARPALLLESDVRDGQAALAARLGLEQERLPHPDFWAWSEDLARQVVPGQVVSRVVEWLEAVEG